MTRVHLSGKMLDGWNTRFLSKSNLISMVTAGLINKRFKKLEFDFPDFPFRAAKALERLRIAKSDISLSIAMIESKLKKGKVGTFTSFVIKKPVKILLHDYGPKNLEVIITDKAEELISGCKRNFLAALQAYKTSINSLSSKSVRMIRAAGY